MRPTEQTAATVQDIENWYWTRAQLDAIARRLGVSRSGSKQEITQRLVAHLSGLPLPPAAGRARSAQLTSPYALSDVVPAGQRMSQDLRGFFIEQVGPGFRFDARMRAFFADPAGRTLADAVALWHLPKAGTEPIPAQFEYNRFTRSHRSAHPHASHAEVRAAWQVYKDTATDQRDKA